MKNILIIFFLVVIFITVWFAWNKKTSYNLNMIIESSAFVNGEMIPSRYTCDGEDVNPSLSFKDVPENTKSLALIVDDPDATRGTTWDHWIVWNISPDITEIAENSVPKGATQGENSWPKNKYGGPCPPNKTHRYFFKLYALDVLLDLSANSSSKELMEAMKGHILAEAELIGRYARK